MALIKCLTKRKLDLEESVRPYHYVPLVSALTLQLSPWTPVDEYMPVRRGQWYVPNIPRNIPTCASATSAPRPAYITSTN